MTAANSSRGQANIPEKYDISYYLYRMIAKIVNWIWIQLISLRDSFHFRFRLRVLRLQTIVVAGLVTSIHKGLKHHDVRVISVTLAGLATVQG